MNKLLKSEALQFTAEIWMGDGEIGRSTKGSGVKVISKNAFPYLDIEMFWNNQDLHFKVYKKNNQPLKYLNRGSAHTAQCFKAIPFGVLD